MNELLRDALRWLLGGGALALATFLGTTAYQQGQLEIERERYLRDFLDRYVELATKGTLDERIRFVQYWESLDVSEKIGVNLAAYKKALANEFNEAETYAVVMANRDAAARPNKSPAPETPAAEQPATEAPAAERPVTVAPTPRPDPPPPEQRQPRQQPATAQAAPVSQEAYFTSRSQTISKLLPGAADAPTMERRGFEALLENDIPAARAAFAAAEQAWPEYHNVAEIHRLLEQASNRLSPGETSLPSTIYRSILQKILKDYSWGMPPGIKTQMQEMLAG